MAASCFRFVGCGFFSGSFVGGFVWGRSFSDGNDGGLLFVDLAEGYGPGGWFVAAAAGGFVEAEGLESSGEGEEEKRGGDEDADVEVGQADVFQKSVRRGHCSSFLHKDSKYDKFSPISIARNGYVGVQPTGVGLAGVGSWFERQGEQNCDGEDADDDGQGGDRAYVEPVG